MAPAEPFEVAFVTPVSLVLDKEEGCLGIPVLTGGSQRDPVIPVEIIVPLEKVLDRLQVDNHIIELLEYEKAAGHALPARDGVAFSGTGSYQLEQLLCSFEMLFGVDMLPVHGAGHAFEDVLTGDIGFHVFDEVEGLYYFVVLEIVDD
jgi:hypothetical protein